MNPSAPRSNLRLALPVVLVLAFAQATRTQQVDPASLPAKDAHNGLTVACTVVTDPAQAKERFGKKTPNEAGILPVELFVRNDNSEAIKIDMDAMKLVLEPRGGQRQRIRALMLQEVVSAIVYKDAPNPSTTRKRLPVPLPGSSGDKKSKEAEKLADAFRPLVFEMDVIPPKATVHGFVFFDLAGHFEYVSQSRLYIPDLYFEQSGKALLFFEVELAHIFK